MTAYDWAALLDDWDALVLPQLRRRQWLEDDERRALERGTLRMPPAQEAEITKKEEALGIPMSPDIRALYRVTNGFLIGFSCVHVLPVSTMDWMTRSDPETHHLLLDVAERFRTLPLRAVRTAVQVSTADPDGLWLLNTSGLSKDGEWQAIEYSIRSAYAGKHASFYAAMTAQYESTKNNLAEILEGRLP